MTHLFISCFLRTSVSGVWIYSSANLTVIKSVLEKFACTYFYVVSATVLYVCICLKRLRNTVCVVLAL